MTVSELHGERAARRGNPSFIWRAGQKRRLQMIRRWAPRAGAQRLQRLLVNGCGTGLYAAALAPDAVQICAIDIEPEHLQLAIDNAPAAALQRAACEQLPYADGYFDLILSHEVLEHVQDDRLAVAEMVRTLRVGGRAVLFVPNRLYPFETHGHFWRGTYHFGNTPLINYLPTPLRNRLAPHVRAYTRSGLLRLFRGLPVRVIHHSCIFPGYDKMVQRRPILGGWLRRITYFLESTPLAAFGLSHLLVVEKVTPG